MWSENSIVNVELAVWWNDERRVPERVCTLRSWAIISVIEESEDKREWQV